MVLVILTIFTKNGCTGIIDIKPISAILTVIRNAGKALL